MRLQHCFEVLSGLVAVALLAADASATYHPTLGRWLQRDPIGYADGMGLYEYAREDPIGGLDPWGTCSCSPGEVKSRFLDKVKVEVDPATVRVTIDNPQECQQPGDIGELCTATVTYLLQPKALGWDPKEAPRYESETRITQVVQCSARFGLMCDCTEFGVGWTLWSYYHWDDDPLYPNPAVVSARDVWVIDNVTVDPTKGFLRRLYNDILGKLRPGLGDLAAPYGVATKWLASNAVKASEPSYMRDDIGKHEFRTQEFEVLGPGEQAQRICVGGD